MPATSPVRKRKNGSGPQGISKCPTGISGLDEITLGGLPRARPTLVCGGPGCGKTLMGMEFLVRGATEFDEPGVVMSFEESAEELSKNVASLGFDVSDLIARKKLAMDYVFIERALIEETGEYDLEALFVRLGHAVDSIGAKRVLLDSVEALFAGLSDESLLRAELRRLFRWLKERQLTAIVTGEQGQGSLTRHGLEEYISDCVILLDHRVADNVFTRRLRVVKYRGSTHGTNEYPFLIDQNGMSVLPLTSMLLQHEVSSERISSGISHLDEMLGGKGYYRGSSILVSGTAGTGKTSITAHFVNAACARGERCLMFSFEESPHQVIRNMREIGIDLGKWISKGLLQFHSERPTSLGLEMHLVKMHKVMETFKPTIVTVDPISGLLHAGSESETKSMLMRLVDFLKSKKITALMTTLSASGDPSEQTATEISSIVDTWLLLRDIESGSERNRGLYVLKARGLAHSNQIREFRLTDHGVKLQDVYLGAHGDLLTGSARVAQEAEDKANEVLAQHDVQKKRLTLEHKQRALEAQIAALQVELETEREEMKQILVQEELRLSESAQERGRMQKSRTLNVAGQEKNGPGAKTRGERR